MHFRGLEASLGYKIEFKVLIEQPCRQIPEQAVSGLLFFRQKMIDWRAL